MVHGNLSVGVNEPNWLNPLLSEPFFGVCSIHQELRKNEKNIFCMDCIVGFCRHCSGFHKQHRKLQICKYVYQDVVRHQDLQKYLDCSKIQTYKINGERAVHLNPRPQQKDAKPSTKAKFASSCEVCGRYLQDIPNRFCSIACKISVVPVEASILSVASNDIGNEAKNSIESESNQTSPRHENERNENEMPNTFDANVPREREGSRTTPTDSTNTTWNPLPRRKKRKGYPRRAPLF